MKKTTFFTLLFTPLFLLLAQSTKATHAVGANISFAHDTLNQYVVTVKFYRNCGDPIYPNPAQAPFAVNVYYSSISCSFNGNVSFNQDPGTGGEIPTGQFPPCYITACQGGTGYGVQEYIYHGTITLPYTCSDWVISTNINARNATITTLQAPNTLSLYVEAKLDNLNNPMDDSPVFSTYPVSRFCINHTFLYNQGATDPDGDSLVFSLVDALAANFGIPPVPTPVPYVTNPIMYSGLNPISSNPAVSIDAATGIITLSPNLVQVGVIAILVEEFRNGFFIGSVRRDMQVNIEPTCNFPPVFQPTTFNNITASCGDTILYLRLTIPVRCNSVAADGSDFRMISPSGYPIPIISETPINCNSFGLTDSIKIKLYSPALFENGTYYIWSKLGNDGNTLLNDCNNAMAEYDTAAFFFNNCYDGVVDLTNVSVDHNNKNMEIYWTAPLNLPTSQFHSFDIYRSDYPGGPYSGIRSLTSSTVNSFVDSNVNIPSKPYNYRIRISINPGYVCPFSDSIQSIFLKGKVNADSTTLNLNWTPYWGWPNPHYEIMQSDDYGNTFYSVAGAATNDTFFVYTKPEVSGTYLVRIHSTNGSLISRSNWFMFDVVTTAVIAPNVITPNGDDKNDTFSFKNLDLYPNSQLDVFNRWGIKVYESNNYLNDWKGESLSEGVYYYTLKVSDKKSSVLTGTVNIIRNK